MNIFVTGIAGLLGGALAAELLAAGHTVFGLVRHNQDIRALDSSLLPASDFNGKLPQAGTISLLQGDVSQPNLGLSADTVTFLSQNIDCMIHCAALVQFEADEDDLARVNVDGARHAAALLPAARFIHVSTAYTCGSLSGPIGEEPHHAERAFANAYEKTKAAGELVVMAQRSDAIIARPSIVVGAYEDGLISSFDTIYRMLKFMAEGRIDRLDVAADATLNFVPIDHVTAALAELAQLRKAGPHFVHLAAQKAIGTRRFLALIGAIDDLSAPSICAPQPGQSAKQSLARQLTRPYAPYFTRAPDFATDNLLRLTGMRPAQMDEKAILRQLSFCVKAGYIRPRAGR